MNRTNPVSNLNNKTIIDFQKEFIWKMGVENQEKYKDFLLIQNKSGRHVFTCSNSLNRKLILKISPVEPEQTLNQPPPLNCIQEAMLLMSINSENLKKHIPEVLGAGLTTDNHTFLIEPFYFNEGISSVDVARNVLLQILEIISNLAKEKILHRDIRVENLRIYYGCVRLIDFNRAIKIKDSIQGLLKNSDVVGVGVNIIPSHENPKIQAQSFSKMVYRLNQVYSSNFEIKGLIDDYIANTWSYKMMNAEQLVEMIGQTRATGDERVWGTDKHIPYYTFEFEGKIIKGERNIDDRLILLNFPDMTGKNYLDFGCNLGLFPVTAIAKYRAELAVGIDIDGKVVECAKIISQERLGDECSKTVFIASDLMDVNVEWISKNIGRSSFEYVSCFSVFRHIQKNGPGALDRFLENVGKICSSEFYFENCSKRPTDQIIGFLRQQGFDRVSYLGKSERNRDICVAYKRRASFIGKLLNKII